MRRSVTLRFPALAVSLVNRVTATADLSSAVTVTDGKAIEITARAWIVNRSPA